MNKEKPSPKQDQGFRMNKPESKFKSNQTSVG